MNTTKKTKRTKIAVPADVATSPAIGFTVEQNAHDRQQLLAWCCRILGEIDTIGQSLTSGTFHKWGGALSDEEQFTLGHALNHCWSTLVDAIPKTMPAELAEAVAQREDRDRAKRQ